LFVKLRHVIGVQNGLSVTIKHDIKGQ